MRTDCVDQGPGRQSTPGVAWHWERVLTSPQTYPSAFVTLVSIPEGWEDNAYIYYVIFNSHLPTTPLPHFSTPSRFFLSLPQVSCSHTCIWTPEARPLVVASWTSAWLGTLIWICWIWASLAQCRATGHGSLMDTGKIIMTFTFFMYGYTSGLLSVLFSCFKIISWILGIAPFSRLGLMRDR